MKNYSFQDGKVCKQHYTMGYQAAHETIIEVYKDVQSAMLRGYIVAQLSHMIQGLRFRGSYHVIFPFEVRMINSKLDIISVESQKQSQILNKIFNEHCGNYRQGTREAVEYASRDVFSCSPDNYIFG